MAGTDNSWSHFLYCTYYATHMQPTTYPALPAHMTWCKQWTHLPTGCMDIHTGGTTQDISGSIELLKVGV